ncbi:hypothetical protein L3X38_007820 [Prunus dulcis]|uniref:Uncharacterized protein n=1 Tax=Prunus dulcis TaxID=3755 RepID=A0AAD4ZV99_PRUDU|nr:hypothetical protein L3X38_007820 [Prunus dulcis]
MVLGFTWVLFPIYREVKVGALHKVPMWGLCASPLWWRHVSWRLGLAFGCFGSCLAPRKGVFLRHGRRRGCLGASRFDSWGPARPRKVCLPSAWEEGVWLPLVLVALMLGLLGSLWCKQLLKEGMKGYESELD